MNKLQDSHDSSDDLAVLPLSVFEFAPHPKPIIFGVLSVAAVATVTVLAHSPLWLTVAVTVVTSWIAIHILLSWHNYRWQQAATAYQASQAQASSWHQQLNQLHESSEQSKTALSQMLDGVVMLSPELEILLINQAACTLFGIPPEASLLGRTFTEIVRIPDVTHAIRAAQGDNGSQMVTVEVADGVNVRPICVRLEKITNRPDSSMLMAIRDETESRRVEAMRREFVANVSHEIKTPIAAIKGYVETAELALDDDRKAAVHFLSQIVGQCNRLERLVADMMQMARAQSGRQHLLIASVDWQQVVSESMRSLRPIAESRKIDVTIDRIEGAFVEADHDATLAITTNLISNAIHYSDDGGKVKVSCCRDGEYWTLAVKDDGVGIPEAEHERIFERFYRVNRNRGSASGGTGIGLAIVRNLTEAQNGKIHLKSRPGEGATFQIMLPAADQSSLRASATELTASTATDNTN